MKDYREPEDNNPFGYNFQWMDVIFIIVIIGIILCAFWAMKSGADEVSPDEGIIIGRTEVMDSCFNAALEAASHIEFETHEDWMDAVSMMTGGCMYYQFLEQSTCQQTPFGYPVEPDERPGEFTHNF